MALASQRIVRPLLELGGNAPFIVCADANLDDAIEGALLGRLRNTGQSCVAANRFLVHESVIDEFGSRLAARFDAMSIGPGVPSDGGTVPDLGPVIDQERVDAVRAMIDDAVGRGGRLLTTRTTVPAQGSFLAPALVRDAPIDSALAREEVFGPAAAISSFTTDADALQQANATEMGLAAYVWTSDAARAWEYSDRLEAGIVGINDPLPSVAFAPMGGTKQSGLGREGSSAGLQEFQETRYVAWRA
jgi:succinate-semialdehyde dehydrogenase/glutarate-semialdehyde dehydrogenase